MADALERSLGLGLLTAYGVGVMVGAGIYVLVGTVVGHAGVWAPLAFGLAGLVALFSALSYAEFATRLPEAAGQAAYVERGFSSRNLGVVAGLAIAVTGIVSAAAVLRGGVGYLMAFVGWPEPWLIVGIGVALTVVALVGVLESLALIAVLTVVEVGGLLAVVMVGFLAPPGPDWSSLPDLPTPPLAGIAAAISLSVFAFIGFEDLTNMAEEAKDPDRVMPRAILLALAITAALYLLVSLAAVRVAPHAELRTSAQPVALIWERATGTSAAFLSAIAVAAALNGVLAQIVMASRVLFGLGRRTKVLSTFARSHPRFGTPVRATLLVGAAMLGAALVIPVETLAETTSIVLLAVFVLVNAALIRLHRREPTAPFRVSAWVPWAGLTTALAALVAALFVILSGESA
ncbi:APC family permease [Tabrizicola sp.]|uniref:APC family permease n=1 Tax=Tabrizicola sp. TaxID=2005166 RepID=UPI002733BC37|nr:APC family permease [Tabrizicola sp.]MDP3194704.1 APC family permease [Tabrizicola sp.]